MNRVRAAVAHPPQNSAPRQPLPTPSVRRVTPHADLLGLFRERAQQTGAKTTKAAFNEIGQHVADLLAQHGATNAVCESNLSYAAQISAASHSRFSIVEVQGSGDDLAKADAGVTGVVAAIAETGSIVCSTGVGRSLHAGLAPRVHVAIVRLDQIIPDLVDLFEALARQPMPAQTTIITGPSKTADIEGILITGVHGPGELHVCIVE